MEILLREGDLDLRLAERVVDRDVDIVPETIREKARGRRRRVTPVTPALADLSERASRRKRETHSAPLKDVLSRRFIA